MKRKHIDAAIQRTADHLRAKSRRSLFEQVILSGLRWEPKPGDVIKLGVESDTGTMQPVQLSQRMITAARKRAMQQAILDGAENP